MRNVNGSDQAHRQGKVGTLNRTLNRDVEKLDNILRDVDKRVVRLETALEFSVKNSIKVIESEE